MIDKHDVVIIGAGPAGLAAAIYTGRARLNTLVLEKGVPGGQILQTDWIENYPGFADGISSLDLIQAFRDQAQKFGARIETEEVTSIVEQDQTWLLKGTRKDYPTRAVIIATGAGYRKLGVEGEERLTGRGVSYCATCDGAFFRDKRIAVVGGGDNALKEALFLTKFCASLKLIHRRDRFRGEKILQERVFANAKIEVLWDTIIESIQGEDRLESLQLRNVKENSTQRLEMEGLFVSIGMNPNSEFVSDLVELNEWKEIRVDSRMQTSRKGLFAAGDVTSACPEQIATAIGTGVSAALALTEYLDGMGH